MIYLELFWSFLKIGLFSFGGGYAAIPLIRETVMSRGWMSEAVLMDFVAVCESTPGPIMVNMATYIGDRQAGVPGAFLATAGVVLPAMVIIILITKLLKGIWEKPVVCRFLNGVIPCLSGIILFTGIQMIGAGLLVGETEHTLSIPGTGVLVILILVSWAAKKKKRTLSPIAYILIAAAAGIIFYR